MVKHNNPSIAQDASRILNSTGEFLSDEVEGPVAVISIQRCANIVRSQSSVATGAVTVFTCPSDKDFYLLACTLAINEDATSDNTNTTLRVVIDGVNQNVINLRKLTTTAINQNISVSIPYPGIKIDRGSVIAMTNTFTVGNAAKSASIIGYTVETTR